MAISLVYVILFLLIFVPPFFLRFFKNLDVRLFISFYRTKKGMSLIKKISKLRFWSALSTTGLVLGFGTLALDYLFFKKHKTGKRVFLVVISFVFLFLFFVFLDFLLSKFFNIEFSLTTIRILGHLSLAGFGLSIFAMVLLAYNAYIIFSKIMVGQTALPGIAPLLPGIEIRNVPIVVPWHGWIILIAILIIHELSHGVQAFVEKIKLKNLGVILLGLLPIGAFVEPDEKQLSKPKNDAKTLRIISAGPTSNIFLAFLLMILVFFILKPVMIPGMLAYEKTLEKRVEVVGITGEPPRESLPKNSFIISIDNKKVSTIKELSDVLDKKEKGAEVLISYLHNNQIFEKNLRLKDGMLGIRVRESFLEEPNLSYKLKSFFLSTGLTTKHSQNFLFWFIILNIVVAFTNFLPILPFDGGRLVTILFTPFVLGKRKTENQIKLARKRIASFFLTLGIFLFIVNILPIFL